MESRIELTDRLRREGRWKEASQFREDERRRLRVKEKLSREVAKERSWQLTAEKFPPLANDDSGEDAFEAPSMPPELAKDLASLSETEYCEDVLWVYSHLAFPDLKPEDAPTAGAWALLRWVRRGNNQSDFYKQMFTKALTIREKRREEERRAQEEAKSEIIEEDIASAEEVWREMEEIMAAKDENYGYEKHAPEIRGILDSLADDEPVGDAMRREAGHVLGEIEKLQREHHPHLFKE